jgi:S1-C subfamily serine protease
LAGFVLAWKPPSQRQKEAGLGLLLKAAQNDYAESQFLLGFNNLFDKKDSSSSKAVGWSWVLKAANANNVLAQSLVGNTYYRGMPDISVQRDPEQAYKWLLLAQGGPNWADMFDVIIRDAKRNMASLEQELSPPRKASAMAMVKAFRDAHGDKRPPSVFEKLARVEKARPGAIEAVVADEPGRQRRESANAAPGKEGKARTSSPQKSYGTGFVVSAQGHVLTNHHVIAGAKVVKTLGIDQPLLVLAKDPANDLALLRLPRPTARPLVFARNLARAGEEAVVMGYPLYGLLGSDPRVTTGTVSALSGIENDTRFMQISAPVQPGNSGGPVLDPSGHVIGVMVAKLDAIKVAEAIGDIPQNVNFALKGELAQAFLRVQGVRFEAALPGAESKPADIAERARESVLLLVVE